MANSTIQTTKEYTSSWTGYNGAVEVKRNGKIVTIRINLGNSNPIRIASSGMNEIVTIPSEYRPNNINYAVGFNGKIASGFPIKLQVETSGKVSFEVDTTIMPVGTDATPKGFITYILN